MSAEPQFPATDGFPKERHLRVVDSKTVDNADPGTASMVHTRKALVPQATPRNNRRTVVFVFALIPVALILILLVNILTASRQYDLVNLRAEEKTLTQENEAISQEIEFYQAPQNLAIRASQLGLVSTSAQASLNLQTGQVEGTPTVATAPEKSGSGNGVLINPPALYDTQAYATASERAEEQKKKQAEEEKKKAEEEKKKKEAEAKASAAASPSTSANPSAESSPSVGP